MRADLGGPGVGPVFDFGGAGGESIGGLVRGRHVKAAVVADVESQSGLRRDRGRSAARVPDGRGKRDELAGSEAAGSGGQAFGDVVGLGENRNCKCLRNAIVGLVFFGN